jgi:hypothetical protein
VTDRELIDAIAHYVGNYHARRITARNMRLRARAKELHRAIHEGRI